MTPQEVLKLGHLHLMQEHIQVLVKAYKDLTNRNVCLVCPGDVKFMLFTLKNHYQMETKFRFRNELSQYRLREGSHIRVSQRNLTDELAIEFLNEDPERLQLFLTVPDGFEIGKSQVEAAKDDCCEDEEEEPCDECEKAALLRMKMNDLREQYPDIQPRFGVKKSDFVDQVIKFKKEQLTK